MGFISNCINMVDWMDVGGAFDYAGHAFIFWGVDPGAMGAIASLEAFFPPPGVSRLLKFGLRGHQGAAGRHPFWVWLILPILVVNQ